MLEGYYQDEEFLGKRRIPGITPQMVATHLADNPLVYKYWKKNSEEVQQHLIEAIMRAPSNSDCPGYIYGFRNMDEYDPKATCYHLKMGRTKRMVPQQRIFEWERDDSHRYVEMFTVRSEHNMKLEALVHILFAYARTTLVINGKNRIEWFHFQEKVPAAALVNLMNLLMENIHDQQATEEQITEWEKQQMLLNQISTQSNQALREILDTLRVAVGKCVKEGREKLVALLKLILLEEDLDKTKEIIHKIIKEDVHEDYEERFVIDVDSNQQTMESVPIKQRQLLASALEKLLECLEMRDQYEKKYGIKFNYALGRIKEAVYHGFKEGEDNESSIGKKKAGEKRQKNKKQQIEVRQKREKEEKKQLSPKVEKQKESEYKQQKKEGEKVQVVREYEKVQTKAMDPSIIVTKQSQAVAKQPQSCISKSKLSQVYQQLKNIQPGETIVNIVNGDFSIDCSHRVAHNIFILAKTIKVYQIWNITFKAVDSLLERGKKINLVLMAKDFINFSKLKIPKNSSHGIASVIRIDNNNSLEGLDGFLSQNSDRLKSNFYEGLKEIFLEKIK